MHPKQSPWLATALSIISLLSTVAPTHAAQRTFVASTGSDANPCTFAAPCRSFAAAIAVTDPNGEVIVTDSAGYGAVTITQSVSIVAAPGVYAGISVFSGQDGITIAARLEDIVTLRGLTINGQGGDNGIWILDAGQVHIENVVVSNVALWGIQIDGGEKIHISGSVIRSNAQGGVQLSAGSPTVSIRDSDILDNGSGFAGHSGISQSVGRLSVNRVQARGSTDGITISPLLGTAVRALITDTELTDNLGFGLSVGSSSGSSSAVVEVTRGVAAGNIQGFAASGQSTRVTITDAVATQNNTGFSASGFGTLMTVRRSSAVGNTVGFNASVAGLLNSCGDNIARENSVANISGNVVVVPCVD